MSKQQWSVITSYGVDSGQVAILPVSGEWEREEYVDRRKPVYKPTGDGIDPKYLRAWATPIAEYDGKSLNELKEAGLLEMQVEGVSDKLSYLACCDRTLYGKYSAGMWYENKAFAVSTTYGDGEYMVLANQGVSKLLVLLSDTHKSSVINELLEQSCTDMFVELLLNNNPSLVAVVNDAPLVVDGKMILVDPCYRDSPLSKQLEYVLDMPAGDYKITLLWLYGRGPEEERASAFLLEKL